MLYSDGDGLFLNERDCEIDYKNNAILVPYLKMYVGCHVHIFECCSNCELAGCHGNITAIDDEGLIHGTWGEEALEPGMDWFEIYIW